MKKQKTLYTITADDVINVANREGISFAETDFHFIEDKVGDYFGDKWQDAIEYALSELEKSKQSI